MNIILNALILIGLSHQFGANAENNRMPEKQTLTQAGQMISLRLVVGEPVRIFVVGKEEAKIDLDSLKLTVRRLSPYPAQVLSLSQKGDVFTITEPVNLETENLLEVTTKVKNKTEKFKFKVYQAPLR